MHCLHESRRVGLLLFVRLGPDALTTRGRTRSNSNPALERRSARIAPQVPSCAGLAFGLVKRPCSAARDDRSRRRAGVRPCVRQTLASDEGQSCAPARNASRPNRSRRTRPPSRPLACERERAGSPIDARWRRFIGRALRDTRCRTRRAVGVAGAVFPGVRLAGRRRSPWLGRRPRPAGRRSASGTWPARTVLRGSSPGGWFARWCRRAGGRGTLRRASASRRSRRVACHARAWWTGAAQFRGGREMRGLRWRRARACRALRRGRRPGPGRRGRGRCRRAP